MTSPILRFTPRDGLGYVGRHGTPGTIGTVGTIETGGESEQTHKDCRDPKGPQKAIDLRAVAHVGYYSYTDSYL